VTAITAGLSCLFVASPAVGAQPRNANVLSTRAAISSLVPGSGMLWGAAVTPRGTQTQETAMESLESQVGTKLAIHRDYLKWDQPPVNATIAADLAHGRIPVISINPIHSDGSFISWASIAAGAQDSVIGAQADAYKKLGVPVFVAFNHEPELARQHGTPADFVAAYRHWVAVYRAHGATNVAFTWILTQGSFQGSGAQATSFYPGDDVVDWIAADGYNRNPCQPSAPRRTFSTVFAGFRNWAAAHPKPLMLAEWGTVEDPTQPGFKASWIADALVQMKNWPQLKAAAYFDSAVGGCSWWVDTSASSLQSYRAISNDPYTKGSSVPVPTPQLPVVTGATLTSVTPTTATVGVTVDPNGSNLGAHLDWGLSTTYGQSTSPVTVYESTGSRSISLPLVGLIAGTTYHLRVVATNADGTTRSPDILVRTPAAPAVAAQVVVDGPDSVHISGFVNPSGLATSYQILWGTTASYDSSTASQSLGAGWSNLAFNTALTGLTPGATYHMMVVATNSAGTASSPDLVVTTQSLPRFVNQPRGVWGLPIFTGRPIWMFRW
jgi:beta-mannanase